jgi:hypothetical protein
MEPVENKTDEVDQTRAVCQLLDQEGNPCGEPSVGLVSFWVPGTQMNALELVCTEHRDQITAAEISKDKPKRPRRTRSLLPPGG